VNSHDAIDALMRTRPGETPASYERPTWHGRAACSGMAVLFHERGQRATEQARRVCAGCPVRRECAAEGEQIDEAHDRGIRAGLTARERYGRWLY